MRLAPLTLLLLPSLASADDVSVNVDVDVNVNAGGGEVQPGSRYLLRGSRWEVGAFLEGGRFEADYAVGGQFGARGELARQFGSLRLGIEGSIAKFGGERTPPGVDWWDTEDGGGEISRVGITARLRSVHRLAPEPDIPSGADGAFYIEGGVGQQYIAWNSGGSDERHDFMFGLGLEFAGGRHRMGGMDLNVRAVVAPSLDSSVETHDVSIIGGLGGRFGL